jgi:hypothetical protein
MEDQMANESKFGGPYVQAAFLCEKVLLEAGNVPTFVRVVDRFMVPKFTQPLPEAIPIVQRQMLQAQQAIQVSLVVLLKAGDNGAGSHAVTIRLQKPDGSVLADNNLSVFFQGGDDNGAMILLPIVIPTPEEGLHWFDVVFEGAQLLTRIPMRVLNQPVAFPGPIQAPPEH